MSLLFKKFEPLKMFFFIARHAKCRQCGSKLIGKGEGGFIFTEGVFHRYCKCGTSVQTGFAAEHPSMPLQNTRRAPYI